MWQHEHELELCDWEMARTPTIVQYERWRRRVAKEFTIHDHHGSTPHQQTDFEMSTLSPGGRIARIMVSGGMISLSDHQRI